MTFIASYLNKGLFTPRRITVKVTITILVSTPTDDIVLIIISAR